MESGYRNNTGSVTNSLCYLLCILTVTTKFSYYFGVLLHWLCINIKFSASADIILSLDKGQVTINLSFGFLILETPFQNPAQTFLFVNRPLSFHFINAINQKLNQLHILYTNCPILLHQQCNQPPLLLTVCGFLDNFNVQYFAIAL